MYDVSCMYVQCSNYREDRGDFPPTTCRRPRHYNSSTYGIPRLKMGWALKKYPFSMPIPLSTFLLIRALCMCILVCRHVIIVYVSCMCKSYAVPMHVCICIYMNLLEIEISYVMPKCKIFWKNTSTLGEVHN